MSAEAIGDCWRRSPLEHDELLVHLAIADVVNDLHGNEFWMKRKLLASKARTSLSTVARALNLLVHLGWLEVVTPGGGTGNATKYQYHLGGEPSQSGMVPTEPSQIRVATVSISESHPLLIPKEPKKARVNPHFDALVSVFGPASTSTRAGFYAKVAAELKTAGATPEEIVARARRIPKEWQAAGPGALVKHWDELGGQVARQDLRTRTNEHGETERFYEGTGWVANA